MRDSSEHRKNLRIPLTLHLQKFLSDLGRISFVKCLWRDLDQKSLTGMSDAHSSTGTNGSYGAAAVRAREQKGNADEKARQNRIAELRRQYLEGTYRVDAPELSAAIVKNHLIKDC